VGFYENFARPILTGLGIVYREQNSDGEILEKTRLCCTNLSEELRMQ
jgi:hypothetical protein